MVTLIITLSLLNLKKPEFVSANEKAEEVDSGSNYSEAEEKGMLMPLDWELKSLAGEKILISEQFKDKVLFVNIWATWCGPCVLEMPSIEKLYEQFRDRIVFICVSEEPLKKIKRFAKKKEIDMPLYALSGSLPEEFESPGIPTTFIISKEGRLAFKYAGAADWSDPEVVNFLNQLLDESKEEKK